MRSFKKKIFPLTTGLREIFAAREFNQLMPKDKPEKLYTPQKQGCGFCLALVKHMVDGMKLHQNPVKAQYLTLAYLPLKLFRPAHQLGD